MNAPIISNRGAARSARAYLQLGVASLGVVIILWALYGVVRFLFVPRSDSGFVEGLAILFFGVYALGGFIVLAVGLLIPQHDESGITVSPRQRKLLAYGVIAPIVSAIVVPIGATILPPLPDPVLSVLVVGVAVLVLSGPLAVLVTLGSLLRSHTRRGLTIGPRRRPILSFVLVAFVVSWAAWGVLALLDSEPGLNIAGLLWLLGGLGPPIAAIVVTQVTDGSQATRQLLGRLLQWRVGWRWYGVAVLLPALVVAGTVIIDAVIRGVSTPTPGLEFALLLVGLIVYSSIIAGGLEEIGWRGFALPRLQSSFDALTASLAIGVVWVVWHAPLFLASGVVQAELPILPFFIQGIALAVVFTWVYNSTRGSLLLVVLLHGAYNAWLSSVWLLREDIDPTTMWIMVALVVVIAVAVIAVYGRAHLSRIERQRA